MEAVILANGEFPHHPIPLEILQTASVLVCCDGAINTLEEHHITPTALVGDLDSVKDYLKKKYASILYHDPDQYTNDLTKAIRWCMEQEITSVKILGATGKREDHTVGNIGLLLNYARMGVRCEMVTDTGTIVPLLKSTTLSSFAGQQVSLFSTNNQTVLFTKNLKYPIVNERLPEWWMGTLNESLGDWFELIFSPGPVIVYRMF